MPTAGIEPGPPAQQASALSITPSPLSSNIHNEKPNFLHLYYCTTRLGSGKDSNPHFLPASQLRTKYEMINLCFTWALIESYGGQSKNEQQHFWWILLISVEEEKITHSQFSRWPKHDSLSCSLKQHSLFLSLSLSQTTCSFSLFLSFFLFSFRFLRPFMLTLVSLLNLLVSIRTAHFFLPSFHHFGLSFSIYFTLFLLCSHTLSLSRMLLLFVNRFYITLFSHFCLSLSLPLSLRPTQNLSYLFTTSYLQSCFLDLSFSFLPNLPHLSLSNSFRVVSTLDRNSS